MHVGWAFEGAALRHPDWPALADGGVLLTYGEWYERASRLAGWLRAQGVRPGTRVAMAMRNREELATCHFATQLAGATSVPLNFRFGARELQHCLDDSSAVLLVHDEHAAAAVQGLERAPLVCTAEDLHRVPAGTPPVAATASDDAGPSLILYTSGTTGLPKGVLRTHRAEHAAALAQIVQHGLEPGERSLGAMTMAHTMGIHTLLAMVLVNGLFVAVPSVVERDVVALLTEHRVSNLFLVPTAFHLLLEQLEREGASLPDCRKLGYAGASMTPALVERCVNAFDPARFVNHYGSTEVYTFSVSPRQREKPGCAGRPNLFGRLRVVTAQPDASVTPADQVPRGETGEVIVSMHSDEAFTTYLNRPDAMQRAVRDGWYFTGDLGQVDEDGDLWLEGRVDDMIITGGENVYPREIEDALAGHPDVAEVAVCGVADERWGQLVTAFVVPRAGSGLTPDALLGASRSLGELASHKRPRRVVLLRELPKSPVGKILRREILAGNYDEIGRS
jgi:2-furoate---CoA ligase